MRCTKYALALMPQVLPRYRRPGALLHRVEYPLGDHHRDRRAGGIGLQLAEQIRVLEWQKVSFLILMILVAVAAIDWISGKLRFAIIGRRAVA